MMKNLASCKIGERVEVVNLLPSEINSKLLEMGIYIGKKLDVLYKAPFGDPIAINVDGYVLSMRKKEAALIEIKLLS